MNSTFHLPVFCAGWMYTASWRYSSLSLVYFCVSVSLIPRPCRRRPGNEASLVLFQSWWWINFFFFFCSSDDERDTNFESRKPTSVRDVRCEEACNRIAVEAVKRGCTDNVTVMIVDIMHPLWRHTWQKRDNHADLVFFVHCSLCCHSFTYANIH